jgi:hypothetical protein
MRQVTHSPSQVTNIRQLPPWSACHYTMRPATATPHSTQHPSLRFWFWFWFCGNGSLVCVGIAGIVGHFFFIYCCCCCCNVLAWCLLLLVGLLPFVYIGNATNAVSAAN